MSRRDRRAALARGKAESTANPTELAARATLAFQEGRAIDAEVLCKQILALTRLRKFASLGVMNGGKAKSGRSRVRRPARTTGYSPLKFLIRHRAA
jgi:hypothetical protein